MTEQNNGWTLIALKEHFEDMFKSHDKRHDDWDKHRIELRDLMKQALETVEKSLNEYKGISNEWRGTVNDVITTRPDRNEMNAAIEKVDASVKLALAAIAKLNQATEREEGAKASGVDLRVAFFGAITTAGVLAAIFFGAWALFH